MGINMLANYLSRSQVREYLAYILEHGTDSIVESPDGVYTVEPMPIRIGSTLNSIKLFRLTRDDDDRPKLTQGSIVLVTDDIKPVLPVDAEFIGIVYMSKFGRDYGGAQDSVSFETYNGDIGDVVWLDKADWDTLSLGKTSDGINCRLFIFWKVA